MKKNLKLMAATTMTAMLLSVGVANADYQPTQDTTVNVTSPISVSDLGTADLTYSTQETVQQTTTTLTGVSVDYDYVWVDVNGTPVLAVDPPCPMF